MGSTPHSVHASEDRFILSSIRSSIDESRRSLLRDLAAPGLDWEYILQAATANRVAWRIHRNLRDCRESIMPAAVWSRLEIINAQTVAHNARLDEALRGALAALAAKGVAVMLLKGSALFRLLRRTDNERPQSDIDLCIHEQDFEAAREALMKLGYAPPRSMPPLAGREAVEYAQCFDQVKFLSADGVKMDMHFRLFNMGMPTGDESAVWGRAIPVDLRGAAARIPSSEDMLLHLCFHANHHCFAKMHFFCDIADVIEHHADAIDWEYLIEIARLRRMQATVYYALSIAGELLGSSVPSGALDALRPGRAKRAVFHFVWFRVMRALTPHFRTDAAEGPLYYILEMDGFAAKLRFIVKMIFPPVSWIRLSYPRMPSRLIRMRYVLMLLRRMRQPSAFDANSC